MRRFPSSILAAVLAAAALAVAAAGPAAAGGDPVPQTKTFSHCGETTWTVPGDVTSVTMTTYGAQGGDGKGNDTGDGVPHAGGGLGGRSTATIAVTPGEVLDVVIGCTGTDGEWGLGLSSGGAGYGTGGTGGSGDAILDDPDDQQGYPNPGGGGGGGTAVLRGVTPLVVAGGGGGGGADNANNMVGGAGGGVTGGGSSGNGVGTCGGGGASAAPGTGGTVAGGVDGEAGAGRDGGDGALDRVNPQVGGWTGGGGGGGGYFGGGGAGALQNDVCGGGGGGAGHVDGGASGISGENGVRAGDGRVELAFSSALTPAPANDDVEDAVELVGPSGTTIGTTTAATPELDEISHALQGPNRSVWYRFDATFDGRAVIDTVGSAVDTLLAVYTGDVSTWDVTEVAANNDAPSTTTSRVAFPVTNGTTYWVAVDAVAPAEGAVTLNWLLSQPRPDAAVRVGSGAPAGDGIYDTFVGQAVTGRAAAGGTVTYRLAVGNDSALPERLRVQGQGSSGPFSIRYRSPSGANITTRVVAGTFQTPELAGGATYVIRAEVTLASTASATASLRRTVRAYSTVDPTRADGVRFTTRRR